MTNSSEEGRWNAYRAANEEMPHARKNELQLMYELVNPQNGEHIVEVGTGNGILTFMLAQKIGTGVIKTFDVNKVNTDSVIRKNTLHALPIECNIQNSEYNLPIIENSIDKVASIAALHHHDDKNLKTGHSGRQKIFNEFYRILKPGGKLIIADLGGDGTIAQAYFDAIDNPLHCYPTGHPHDGTSKDLAHLLSKNAGFRSVSYQIEKVPWQFRDENEAKLFLHKLHNAQCTPEESLEIALKHLGLKKTKTGVELGWDLAYIVAEK